MHDYWAGDDFYCWKQSATLRNKLYIHDAATLQKVESEIVRGRAIAGLPTGRFSISHYKACHKWLFGDVYAWAGRYRTVRLAKEKSVFCFPEYIDAEMTRLFADLKAHGFLAQQDRQDFVRRTAWFWSEINAIHPFREGNGRTQTLFLANMALQGGWYLDLTRLNPIVTISAKRTSFQAGSGGPLEALVDALIKP